MIKHGYTGYSVNTLPVIFYIALGILAGLASSLLDFLVTFGVPGLIFTLAGFTLPCFHTGRHLIVPPIGFFAAYAVFILSFGLSALLPYPWHFAPQLALAGAVGGLLTTWAYLPNSRDLLRGTILGACLGLSGLWGVPELLDSALSFPGSGDDGTFAPLFVCWQSGMLGFYAWRLHRNEQNT